MSEKLDHMKDQKEKADRNSATTSTRKKCWSTGYRS